MSMLHRIMGAIAGLVVAYAFGAVVAATPVISDWSPLWRFWCVTWGLAWAIALSNLATIKRLIEDDH